MYPVLNTLHRAPHHVQVRRLMSRGAGHSLSRGSLDGLDTAQEGTPYPQSIAMSVCALLPQADCMSPKDRAQ